MKLLICLAFLFLSAGAEKARFDNYRLYSVQIENQDQYEAMKYLEEHSDSYDFFEPAILNGEAEILVPPHMYAHFDEISQNLNMKTKLTINNYQSLIDDEENAIRKRKATAFIDWDSYGTLAEINAWLDEMHVRFPTITNIRTVGTTHEGRPIRAFSISRRSGNRAIIIEANIHSREWISSATATYLINELLTSTDPTIQALSANIDWHIITNANPDGYEFSRTNNRNWRKTRAPVSALCFGVDANRNFGYNWLVRDETGSLGASTTPCSDTFAGAQSMTEAETLAIESLFTQYARSTDLFISFHSYGHYLLHPWGHTRNMPPNNATLVSVGVAFRDALRAVDGINYAVGSSNVVLYAATGTTPDHAYGAHGIPLSYTIEMRGNGVYGNYGFVLPPNLIRPNAIEVVAGLKAMINEAKRLGYLGGP
jgi:carboxypeptidase A